MLGSFSALIPEDALVFILTKDNRPLRVCFLRVLSRMAYFTEKENGYQINVLKEIKSP